jgi:P-type Ca2+ transporter type 2B
MTGETDPIKKCVLKDCIARQEEVEKNGEKNISDRHEVPSPIVMSGTKVLSGEGKLLILVVGPRSCIGRVRAKLEQDEVEPTPLQSKLETLAGDIGRFGLYSAIVIVVVLLIRFAIVKGMNRNWDTGADLKKLLDYLLIAITVVVVAIPEGLPLSVTLSLAFSVKKMLKDQNLVRKMEACETMGGANNICSDKTGTLTMNKMTLSQIWNVDTKVIDIHKEKFTDADLTSNA